MRITRVGGWLGGLTAAAVLCVGVGAAAQEDLNREFEFASKLVEIGFADYAERLVDEIVRLHPDQKDRSKMLQAEILTARKKFDDAEKLLKEMPAGSPTTQAARLAVANGLYRSREIDRAKKIYQEFFDQYKDKVPTDPDLKRFYMESAFRFGQMLEKSGDMAGSVKAYENVLKCNPEPGIARKMRQDLAYMLVNAGKAAQGDVRKGFLDRAWKICEEIQWGKEGIDLTFGHSIVVMANIEVLRGKSDDAAKLIKHNLDLMKGLDEILKEQKLPLSESPLAPTRFLLGDIMQKKGEAAGVGAEDAVKYLIEAISQYANVFAKYGDSDWGPDAGSRVESIRDTLKKKYKKEIKIDLKQYKAKAVGAQFRMADELFIQKRYEEAARETLKVLNAFPSMETAGPMFSNLLMCYANLKNALYLDVTCGYIAECRRADPTSGLALLAAAKFYFDQKDTAKAVEIYDLFVTAYPKHEKTPQVLFLLSGILKKDNREADGEKYLKRIVEEWPNDQFYLKAMIQMAWSKYQSKDYKTALELFQKYIKDSTPDNNRASAQFTLADCYVRLEDYANSVKEYRTLISWLTPQDNNPYGKTTDEVKRNAEMMQKSRFSVGYGLAKIPAADEATKKAIRQKAIEELQAFLKDYATSDLAPKAMNVIGTIYLDLGQTEAASTTFTELQTKYPKSEDGMSALYSLIMAAMKINKIDIALTAFQKMMDSEPADQPSKMFTPDQLVRVGQGFIEAGRDKEAVVAFRRVTSSGVTDRKILERTLYGMGMASYRMKKFDEAISGLDEMLRRYPNSGLYYDAKLTLGRAYRDAGKLPEAVSELTDVFKSADDPTIRDTANVELGMIEHQAYLKAKEAGKTAEAQEALRSAMASYERVVMFGDEKNAIIRPLVEQALLQSIPLYEETGRFDKVIEKCETYVAKFPESPKVADMRKKAADARMKAATAAPAPAPAAGGAAGTPK